MNYRFDSKYEKPYVKSLRLFIIAPIVLIAILSYTSIAFAIDLSLTWNASARTDGYRLFYREQGQGYNYNSPDWEGTATTCTIRGLDDYTNYHFVVRAYNDYGESGDSSEATWVPGVANSPPVLNPIGSKSVDEGKQLTITITASDPDGDDLSYSASNLPSGADFNVDTQTFDWIPSHDSAGSYILIFKVTDDGTLSLSDEESVTINVIEVGGPPSPPTNLKISY